jgi:dynein heavy chain
LDTILSIQPKESAVGGVETRETIVARLATDMLNKLPKDYDPFEVKNRYNTMFLYLPREFKKAICM